MSEIFVDLSQPHAYRNWNIVSQETVNHSDGRTYFKIHYETAPSLIQKIAIVVSVVICSFFVPPLMGCAMGLCLVLWLVKSERKQEVLSETSLEDHFLNRIQEASSIDNLYQRALRIEPNLHISLVGKEAARTQFNGCARFNEGAVEAVIGRTEDEILSIIVFEITNFIQKNRFYALDHRTLTADEYAKENERIEYDGTKMHHAAVSKAIRANNWSPSIDIYKKTESDFASHWNRIKNSAHAEYYRAWHRAHFPAAMVI